MLSNILKCLVVDDEKASQQLIEKYIQKVPYLQLAGICDDAIDAIFKVQELLPDVIFLDVQMPEMNGFEFLRSLQTSRPRIIMISADASYAIEGFEHQVADYLLKPVAFERFMRAITKVFAENTGTNKGSLSGFTQENPISISTVLPEADNVVNSTSEFLVLKEDKKLIRVEWSEIVFIEAMKDYLKVHLAGRFLVTHMTMTDAEKILPTKLFFRVHRSFIVNKKLIREISGNEITITANKKIPIGKTFRSAVISVFSTNKA